MGGEKPFAGKVAVVTGGTQGLGEAIARLLAERGAAGVVVTGRDRARGEAVARALGEHGAKGLFVPAELGDVDQARTVVARCDEAFGRVDVLVNAAALTERGNILSTTPEFFDRMFAVNVRAPFFLMQDAVRVMLRERIEGAVVNILSMSDHGGQSFLAPYVGSKAALAALTRNVAFSLMPHRIRVNGLNIGWTDTEGEDDIQRQFHGAGDDWREEAARKLPFGRLGQVGEIADFAVYLLSERSGVVTGSVIDWDQNVIGALD
jgi:NAD(P)-dependent dehydrogenase (short-subunit alcohol dehydrogenase family)